MGEAMRKAKRNIRVRLNGKAYVYGHCRNDNFQNLGPFLS